MTCFEKNNEKPHWNGSECTACPEGSEWTDGECKPIDLCAGEETNKIYDPMTAECVAAAENCASGAAESNVCKTCAEANLKQQGNTCVETCS